MKLGLVQKEKLCWRLIVLLIALAIIVPIGLFVGIVIPANWEYNKKFGSHVVMAKDQATFSGMIEQVGILWDNMNTTFTGRNFNETYNSPWYWDWTYDNSLGAQRDYFKHLMERLNNYQMQYQFLLKNNSNPIYINDWYDKSVQNMRNEMNRAGGLDWALKDAWCLTFAPMAFWSGLIDIIYWIVTIVTGILIWIWKQR